MKINISRNKIYLKSLITYSAAKVLPGLIVFASIPLWTRTYGNAEYGIFASVWAIALLTSAMTTGWMRQALLRYSGDPDHSLFTLPKWVLPLVTFLSGLIMLGTISVVSNVGNALSVTLLLSSLSFSIFNTLYAVLQTNAQRLSHTTSFLLAEITRVSIALIASFPIGNLFEFSGAESILCSYTMGTILGVAILRQRGSTTHVMSSGLETLKSFWIFGWPMTIWLSCSSAFSYIDRLLLGALSSAEVTGVYSAFSDMILRGFAMVSFPLTMVAHPIVMKAWNSGDKQNALEINRRFIRYLLFLSLFITAGLIAFGTVLLEWVLNVKAPSPYLVPLLSIGAALWQLSLLAHKPLEMNNRTKSMAMIILIIALLSALANYLFIPLYGVLAPALIFASGALTYFLVTTMLSKSSKLMKRK